MVRCRDVQCDSKNLTGGVGVLVLLIYGCGAYECGRSPLDGLPDVLGDSLGVEPGVPALRRRAGGGFKAGDGSAAPGRFCENHNEGMRARAASSSCSYAAVALARSLFRKGANFTAAIAFELASTNLVAELAIIMVVLLGWQFAAAEFIGAPVMVAIMAWLFGLFLKPAMVDEARTQTERGLHGKMEGHAEMDMAVTEGPVLKRILSERGKTGAPRSSPFPRAMPGRTISKSHSELAHRAPRRSIGLRRHPSRPPASPLRNNG